MKQNVFDIKTKEKVDIQHKNTPVHSFIALPAYFSDSQNMQKLFESYKEAYKTDSIDLRAYIIIFNSQSSEKFIKDSIVNSLPFFPL